MRRIVMCWRGQRGSMFQALLLAGLVSSGGVLGSRIAAGPGADPPRIDRSPGPDRQGPLLGSLLAAEAAPAADTVTLKDGKTLEGVILDITDKAVRIRVGSEERVLARPEVKDIVRGAPKKALDFFEKKFAGYKEGATATTWEKLAEWCQKQGIFPERRRALREVVRLDPTNSSAHLELGHAELDGNWLDEDQVAAKVKEGFEVVGGKLVKASKTTAVKETPAEAVPYRVLERKKLTKTERDKMERERKDRLEDAEKFLKQKEREYEGIPWDKRHKLKSRNFEVQCNSTIEVARAYSALMEIIRAELAKMFPSRILRELRAPVFIYASQEDFMNQDEFARWGGRGLGGYYNPGSQAITTYHGTFGFTGTTFGVLCHEGTHYYQGLVLQQFDNIPIWLIEGLAVYFGDGSVFDPVKRKIHIGDIPRDRLAHIQEKMLVKRHTPIDKLVAMNRRTGGFTGSHYADAWALIYYLVNSGKKGQDLLKAYWAIGLERPLDKRDFTGLAVKYFKSVEELEKQYVDYILKLDMPPAGKVIGDYYVSDSFQFDFKAPGEEWQFFEDKEDKKLLVGLQCPGTSAEIRIYYENNLENTKSDKFFEGYLRFAKNRYKEVKEEKAKISNLDGYKVSYVDENSDSSDLVDLSELIGMSEDGPVVVTQKPKKKSTGPREVVKFLLIQVDGVVSIECSTKKGELEKFADVFNKANENFTLTLTRRW